MESSTNAHGRMIEVASHRSALRASLNELQVSAETAFPATSKSSWFRWTAIAALGLSLLAAITFVSWWAGDMSSRANRHNLIVAKRTIVADGRSVAEKQSMGLLKDLDPADKNSSLSRVRLPAAGYFSELYLPKYGGSQQLASVSQAIELEHFQPKFPSYTLGGRIDKVYVVGSSPSASFDVTYTSGMAFRATASGSRPKPNFAEIIRTARQEGNLAPDEMPYLVAISDTIGLMWPACIFMGVVYSPVVSWWDNGITYDVTTGKHDFEGDDSAALREVEKIAESFSGRTRVPAPAKR